MADTADLKSAARNGVTVRPCLAAPIFPKNTSGFQKRTHDNRFGFLLRTVFEENYDLGVAT